MSRNGEDDCSCDTGDPCACDTSALSESWVSHHVEAALDEAERAWEEDEEAEEDEEESADDADDPSDLVVPVSRIPNDAACLLKEEWDVKVDGSGRSMTLAVDCFGKCFTLVGRRRRLGNAEVRVFSFDRVAGVRRRLMPPDGQKVRWPRAASQSPCEHSLSVLICDGSVATLRFRTPAQAEEFRTVLQCARPAVVSCVPFAAPRRPAAVRELTIEGGNGRHVLLRGGGSSGARAADSPLPRQKECLGRCSLRAGASSVQGVRVECRVEYLTALPPPLRALTEAATAAATEELPPLPLCEQASGIVCYSFHLDVSLLPQHAGRGDRSTVPSAAGRADAVDAALKRGGHALLYAGLVSDDGSSGVAPVSAPFAAALSQARSSAVLVLVYAARAVRVLLGSVECRRVGELSCVVLVEALDTVVGFACVSLRKRGAHNSGARRRELQRVLSDAARCGNTRAAPAGRPRYLFVSGDFKAYATDAPAAATTTSPPSSAMAGDELRALLESGQFFPGYREGSVVFSPSNPFYLQSSTGRRGAEDGAEGGVAAGAKASRLVHRDHSYFFRVIVGVLGDEGAVSGEAACRSYTGGFGRHEDGGVAPSHGVYPSNFSGVVSGPKEVRGRPGSSSVGVGYVATRHEILISRPFPAVLPVDLSSCLGSSDGGGGSGDGSLRAPLVVRRIDVSMSAVDGGGSESSGGVCSNPRADLQWVPGSSGWQHIQGGRAAFAAVCPVECVLEQLAQAFVVVTGKGCSGAVSLRGLLRSAEGSAMVRTVSLACDEEVLARARVSVTYWCDPPSPCADGEGDDDDGSSDSSRAEAEVSDSEGADAEEDGNDDDEAPDEPSDPPRTYAYLPVWQRFASSAAEEPCAGHTLSVHAASGRPFLSADFGASLPSSCLQHGSRLGLGRFSEGGRAVCWEGVKQREQPPTSQAAVATATDVVVLGGACAAGAGVRDVTLAAAEALTVGPDGKVGRAGLPEMPCGLRDHASVYLPGRDEIVVYGGASSDGTSAAVFCYAVRTKTWRAEAAHTTAREGHSMTCVDDGDGSGEPLVAVFGGSTTLPPEERRFRSDLECLSVTRRGVRWKRVSNTGCAPTPRSGHFAASCGPRCLVIGGGWSGGRDYPGAVYCATIEDGGHSVGGRSGGAALQALWREVASASGGIVPALRRCQAAACQVAPRTLLLHGGSDDTGSGTLDMGYLILA